MNTSGLFKDCGWDIKDTDAAQQQGWNVFLYWEGTKPNGRRTGLVIQRDRDDFPESGDVQEHTFPSDEAARDFVVMAAKAGDKLAQRAVKAVFLSQCQPGRKA